MMREKEKEDLKLVLQGAWVKGIRWFAFGTDAADLSSPDHCAHVGSLSTAFWPFENVAQLGVTQNGWNALDPTPKQTSLVAVDAIKAVWVGNHDQDGSSICHVVIYPRQ
jgi:hypothetical protein